MLRSAFAIVAVVVLTIALGLPAAALSLIQPKGDWVIRLGRLWARGICAASGVTVEGRGMGALPRGRPFLLISNHLSHFDLLAILLTFPASFRVVAKRLLFYIPVFGWCLWASGMIPIDRTRRASAIESLDRAAERARTGLPILFFSEGTRSRDGSLQTFKKGAFVIAVKSQIPIVPVSVRGSYDVLPKGSIRIRPGHIVAQYGKEIPASGYTMETKDALIAQVHAAVAAGLGRDASPDAAAGANQSTASAAGANQSTADATGASQATADAAGASGSPSGAAGTRAFPVDAVNASGAADASLSAAESAEASVSAAGSAGAAPLPGWTANSRS